MITSPRHILVLLSSIAVLVGASTPAALAAGGCGGSPYSALNQYCETVPTAKGSQAPAVGAPSLATSLPADVVTRIQRSASGGSGGRSGHRAALRSLLSLPASPAPSVQRAVTSDGGFPLWLSLVLAATALALVLAAAKRRRGRRQDGTSG